MWESYIVCVNYEWNVVVIEVVNKGWCNGLENHNQVMYCKDVVVGGRFDNII